jgi:hypothetical protein
MSGNHKGLTRRDFLKRGAAGVTLAGAAAAFGGVAGAEEQARSSVVLVRDPAVLGADRAVKPDVVAKLLDMGVRELTGKPDAPAAWAEFLKPADVVGVKSNTWPALRTPTEVENVIVAKVTGAGVPADKVAVEDRGAKNNPVFQNSTAIINVRPMRSHHWAGVGSCIKNFMPFSDDCQSLHPNYCEDLGSLWELPMVKGKTRLNILVMLTPLFHSKGPHNFDAKYTWDYAGFLLGTDPVAVDTIGLSIIQAKRKEFFKEESPLPITPHHIRFAAEKYHLGIADRDRIDLKKVGVSEGSLI